MIFCLSWMDLVTSPHLPLPVQALKMANKAILHKTTFFHSLIKDDYSYLVKGDRNQARDDLNQAAPFFHETCPPSTWSVLCLAAEAIMYKILYKLYKCVQTPNCEFIIALKPNKIPSTCKVLAEFLGKKTKQIFSSKQF